ncbi:unnamed protein product [Cylindrotheca closterium]|uniref:Uncharacterized protein n=1 Tax=Cylindrotheca closterium TaxID=2856 RepID=A0AAD2JGX9_9STRA|nr:unnamed protein product [Cylindrotheca closterium]
MGSDNDTITRRRHNNVATNNSTYVASGGAWNSPVRNPKGKKKKKRRNSDDDIPFVQLFAQVGITLLAVSIALWLAYQAFSSFRPPAKDSGSLQFELDDDDDFSNPETPEEPKSLTDALKSLISDSEQEKQTEEPTYPPLPTFMLSESSKWDPYGLAETFSGSEDAFWKASKGLRQLFADTYGGENPARMLLDKGMTTFFESIDGKVPEDIAHTACRFQRAQNEDRPLRLAFAGYSVTAGRGNYFHQSFPFQLQRTLEKVVRLAGVEQGLEVRNAAIGGAPAFPYAFCFENFLGPNPDVISWDYSMNEAGGVPEGLEAYVRHMIATYTKDNMSVPKLIVKDTHMAPMRRRVLHEYANLVPDSVVLHTDPATKPFLERYEEYRPIGFQDWRKFGAPHGAPGQAAHHPALKEHELLGWILAMHFLTALEYKMMAGSNLSCLTEKTLPKLPPPVSDKLTNTTNPIYDPVLFGHKVSADEWKINPIQCGTTFQPILKGDLSELVVNGSIAEDLDALLPKSQYYYNQGWVLDMSEGIKAAMRKLSTYEDNLGFIDSKEAYYGLFESPHLNLLLPYSGRGKGEGDGEEKGNLQPGQEANNWFESIILCQVNEQREDNECDFGRDVGVSIGGVNVTDISPYMMEMGGTTYLGKKVCSHIPIPNGAVLTSHNTLAGKADLELDQMGLLVEVFVTNKHIVHAKQACSISHVVWEEKLI